MLADRVDTLINESTPDLIELNDLLNKLDLLYYTPGQVSPITDANYDVLVQKLRKFAPEHERFTRVGPLYSLETIGSKVTHTIPMGSLDNTEGGIAGYESWLLGIITQLNETVSPSHLAQTIDAIPVVASYKIDGASICASYVNGKLVRVATRGNGEVGEDITANGAKFRFLPTLLPHPVTIEVRGEAVLTKANFELVCQDIPEAERSNPRNVGNGILGRHDGTDSQYLDFLAFNLYHDSDPYFTYNDEIGRFQALTALGFCVVPHRRCDTIAEFRAFYDETVLKRSGLEYEIDGIVVALNDLLARQAFITADKKSVMRPKYARAVKFDHKAATTTIEDVVVTVGHTRAIIPTAKVRTVRIGGVNVSNVLLNNYEEIARFELALGDEVELILAGDIVPKLRRVVKTKETKYRCPKCDFTGTEDEQRKHHGK